MQERSALNRDTPKIVILGAGPTGLGAAWRLHELGHTHWQLFERAPHAGGLASSFTDAAGFTWDIGGHVQFSHYDYFDRVMEIAHPPDQWLHHERESWIWMRERFIPYPLQYNIGLLPEEERDACLRGLEWAGRQPRRWASFSEWIDVTFGPGLRAVFMEPYNLKVWAWPLEQLDAAWVGERVAVPDLGRIRENIARARLDCSWGPNNRFRFPRVGGTGSIWRNMAAMLPADRLHFSAEARAINAGRRRLTLADGRTVDYDVLISSIPLDTLLAMTGDAPRNGGRFLSSASNIFGVGLRGAPPEALRKKCWMYYPEPEYPFYRVTVFSNYSPRNVPGEGYWSLMAEVADSPHRPVDHAGLRGQVIDGLVRAGHIEDLQAIVSVWQMRVDPGYPTPFLGRDALVDPALERLQHEGIYSRGRFGAWKYEVSNQDHSFMQGVEAVDHILEGRKELTVYQPDLVNAQRTR